eukprot:1158207-Rhodomonas_salina.1
MGLRLRVVVRGASNHILLRRVKGPVSWVQGLGQRSGSRVKSIGLGVLGLVSRVDCLGSRVDWLVCLGSRAQGLGFPGVWGRGSRVECLGSRVECRHWV